MRTIRPSRAVTLTLVIAAASTVTVIAAEALSGASKLMMVTASKYPGKVHLLPATMETTQWGWFDNAQAPVLTINSGDTVVMETMMHSHNQVVPGRTIDEIKKLRTDHPGRGPHTLTDRKSTRLNSSHRT